MAWLWWGLLVAAVGLAGVPVPADAADGEVRFDIRAFVITGNTLFDEEQLRRVLAQFTGSARSAADVEKARAALERFYHQQGYPTALANIPEQSVDEGLIRLEVIESRIRRVRVTGNRYFTMEKILDALPSFREGSMLHLPAVQTELTELNRNPDLKVAPLLMPGKALGTIDVELKVKDKLPLHGSLELNNRNTHTTKPLRLNGMLRYDNLWQREHSLSFQFQTAPEDTDAVQLLSSAYVWPSWFGANNMSVLYGVLSDSDSAFGEGFNVIGKGFIVGFREIVPLPSRGALTHNLSLGIDYKDFDEELIFGEASDTTPVSYVPLSVAYSGSLRGDSGVTRFNAGLSLALRGLVSSDAQFADKRYSARGNYLVLGAGAEREQQLPLGMRALVKIGGQLADQPLIANEQFVAGGMTSVRGYHESEAAGDNALTGHFALSSPDLARVFGLPEPLSFRLQAFYDAAYLAKREPLPGESRETTLQGTGAGLRVHWGSHFEAALEWGMALDATGTTENGAQVIYFSTKLLF